MVTAIVVLTLLAVCAVLMIALYQMTEPYEPTRCEHCGQIIEEGADMALEDGWEPWAAARRS